MKSYKQFIKEYSMGLQVPSMGYLKPVGSLNPLRKKENRVVATAIPQGEMKPLKQKDEVSGKLKAKVLARKISRFKTKFRQNLKDKKP